jgi:hypothetical protein
LGRAERKTLKAKAKLSQTRNLMGAKATGGEKTATLRLNPTKYEN